MQKIQLKNMEDSMYNCPCLDAKKVQKGIQEVCEKLKIDAAPFMDVLAHANIGWFSRSMAVSGFVFAQDKDDRWYVLATQRGQGAADYQGCWCCPCGYLDFHETTTEAIQREIWEECGLMISPEGLHFCGYEDNPSENHQNVTFRFFHRIYRKTLDEIETTTKYNEPDEVEQIQWIPLDIPKLSQYTWAFGHDEIIKRLAYQYNIYWKR